MKEFEKSMSFGLSFISTLFFSGLSGYGVGKYYFEAPETKCLIIAAIFLIGTLIMETLIFIIKTTKN